MKFNIQRIGLFILFPLVGIGYYSLYSDLSAEILAENSLRFKQMTELNGIAQLNNEFQNIETQKDIINKKIGENKNALPSTSDVHILLAELQNNALDANVELIAWEPQKEDVQEFYVRVPLKISLTGSYGKVLKFLSITNKMKRLVKVENLQIKSSEKDDKSQVSCVIVAYRSKNQEDANTTKRNK